MRTLNLPTFAYKVQPSKTGYQIFDVVRKKYVCLTPEEWVRQHFLHYLIGHLAYPKSLISVERVAQYNNLLHRPDIVVYNRLAQPLMLVECKAPSVAIHNQKTLGQIARYHARCKAQILVITNGIEHFCCKLTCEQGNYALLPSIPCFDTLV